jgi:hypothetical protein
MIARLQSSARSLAAAIVLLLLGLSSFGQEVCAQQPSSERLEIIELDPAKTTVDITLDAFLHTVHGTFHVKRGTITLAPATSTPGNGDAAIAKAGGLIVVDATSGSTDNDSRDKTMHRKVLESDKFPDVTFTPVEIRGRLAPEGDSQITILGILGLHGQNHDLTAQAKVHIAQGQWTADAEFAIPYVMWGLKNPSNLVLHVKDTVQVQIHAAGRIRLPTAAN